MVGCPNLEYHRVSSRDCHTRKTNKRIHTLLLYPQGLFSSSFLLVYTGVTRRQANGLTTIFDCHYLCVYSSVIGKLTWEGNWVIGLFRGGGREEVAVGGGRIVCVLSPVRQRTAAKFSSYDSRGCALYQSTLFCLP